MRGCCRETRLNRDFRGIFSAIARDLERAHEIGADAADFNRGRSGSRILIGKGEAIIRGGLSNGSGFSH